MTVDLSKAKPGMIVKFRCGGQAVIDSISHHGYTSGTSISFKDTDNHVIFENKGNVYPDQTTLIDIIALEEPPFDWKDVKPGMAFRDTTGYVLYYVGQNPMRQLPVFSTGAGDVITYSKILTRSPEHDKIKENP